MLWMCLWKKIALSFALSCYPPEIFPKSIYQVNTLLTLQVPNSDIHVFDLYIGNLALWGLSIKYSRCFYRAAGMVTQPQWQTQVQKISSICAGVKQDRSNFTGHCSHTGNNSSINWMGGTILLACFHFQEHVQRKQRFTLAVFCHAQYILSALFLWPTLLNASNTQPKAKRDLISRFMNFFHS